MLRDDTCSSEYNTNTNPQIKSETFLESLQVLALEFRKPAYNKGHIYTPSESSLRNYLFSTRRLEISI